MSPKPRTAAAAHEEYRSSSPKPWRTPAPAHEEYRPASPKRRIYAAAQEDTTIQVKTWRAPAKSRKTRVVELEMDD